MTDESDVDAALVFFLREAQRNRLRMRRQRGSKPGATVVDLRGRGGGHDDESQRSACGKAAIPEGKTFLRGHRGMIGSIQNGLRDGK